MKKIALFFIISIILLNIYGCSNISEQTFSNLKDITFKDKDIKVCKEILEKYITALNEDDKETLDKFNTDNEVEKRWIGNISIEEIKVILDKNYYENLHNGNGYGIGKSFMEGKNLLALYTQERIKMGDTHEEQLVSAKYIFIKVNGEWKIKTTDVE